MLAITPLRTKRLQVRMKELTIADAIYLCRLPAALNEVGTSELLRRTVEPDAKPRVGQVADYRMWTVQERAMAVCNYLAHMDKGDPNFAVGDGKLSDYMLEGEMGPKPPVDLGTLEGDHWLLTPMLGAHAESIERLIANGTLPPGREGWWFGSMAATLVRAGEPEFAIEDAMDAALDDYIARRAETFRKYPESACMDMIGRFLRGVETMDHIFRIDFSDDGIVFLPTNREVPGLPPARFPFHFAVSEAARSVFGKA